ncbi:hypothetical protein PQX77_013736 [Marasmius sp. AFHP31]|nr:hypothetical protein PQX77_013736 [Marasmius sp. AFHP31]
MAPLLTWQDPVGLDTITKVTACCIPEWPNGLHDYQLDPISKILDRKSVFFVGGTGCEKAALFMVPLVVHRELTVRPQPQLYPNLPVQERAVVVVITPTKGLASSIISEAESLGLNGLSYCHNTWDLICVDPEHLNSIDEAHLIKSWGLGFRPAFDLIGACARGHLPHSVPILALTATLPPGQSTVDVLQSLGLEEGHFHFIRCSNERDNMHIAVETMQRIPGMSKYAPLLDYLRSGRKTVVHVNTIPVAYEIYEFLWSHSPDLPSTPPYADVPQPLSSLRPSHLLRAPIGYSSWIAFRGDFPLHLDDFWQVKGRAGRKPGVVCRGVAIVPKKMVESAQNFLNALEAGEHAKTTAGGGKKSKRKGRKKNGGLTGEMEEGKARFLAETSCYNTVLNQYYGNPPTDATQHDCMEANRKVFCGLCSARYSKNFTVDNGNSVLVWLPIMAQDVKKTRQ